MSQRPNRHSCAYCGTTLEKDENPFERKCGHFDSGVRVHLSATVTGEAKVAG